MKITISSPDGLGDFILRVPMIRAFLEDGHRLQLLLRQPAEGLAREIFPGIECHAIESDPYHPETRRKKKPFRVEQDCIRKFNPDLYVASLFAINFFDEIWFEADGWQVPVAGFAAREEFWPSGTIEDPRLFAQKFQICMEVSAGLPDIEKNRLLGSSILGRDVPACAPRIEASGSAVDAAKKILCEYGLCEGEYWIACVGGRKGLRMKDWGSEKWRGFFCDVIPQSGKPVVFLGNPKESESIEFIRSGSYPSINLATNPPDIAVSLALTGLSAGYVGRDSGVMHLACATGRPVVAVYGGAHWGRFLPSSGPAVVVTQDMSCRMCDFACPHPQPFCVTEIHRETMVQAWNILPKIAGIHLLEQPIDQRIDIYSAQQARQFSVETANQQRVRETAGRKPIWEKIFFRN